MASLPLKIYTRAPGGLAPPARYIGPSLFDNPSVSANLFDWLYQCMTSLVLHGNAWGMITGRDGYGYPTGIDWVPPDMVTVIDDSQQPWNPLRTRVYIYGRLIDNWRDDLLHIRAFTIPGRTEGISPLRAFALTVMNGIEAQQYGTDWFGSGGFPTGTFQNTQIEIDPAAAEDIRESLTSAIQRKQPLVYGRDWDFKPVVVPPSEAQFLEAIQANATQVAAIYGLPPDRVGGKRGDSLTYNCVSSDTDILSTRGWLHYDQVTTEDTCLTLNPGTGAAEWQPVSSVHVFDEGPYPVVELENKSHSSVSTPDHRWPVMISGRPGAKDGYQWRTTETMPWDARICAAAPVVAPVEPKWSDALTELVAWFWTEGWHNEYCSVTIAQSDVVNQENVVRIRLALTELFGSEGELQVRSRPSWREDRDERGLVHFRLNAKAGRVLLEHAPGKVVSTEFLSQLTRAQLELFVQTSLDADGSRHGASWTMGQKDKARLEAFQVACALTGRSGVIQGPNRYGMYVMPIQLSPWRKPKGHPEYVSEGTEPLVWCVQTPNKTWFARRNGTCYFTGNTVEQSTLQVIEALRPWMVRLETAFFDLLPQNRYVRFNADALLKTDLKTRTEIELQQRAMGLLTIDEIRDREDMAPFPNSAGDEKIPLEVMVAMARSIRGIPNSMLNGVTLEMDLAVDRLQKLQVQNPPLAQPNVEPAVKSPASLLASAIAATRGLEDMSTDDVIRFLRETAARVQEAESGGPDYVGAWISPDGGTGARDSMSPQTPENTHVPYDPAMFTAHRIDEVTHHLTHTVERIKAARAARGDARAYETDHVLQDLDEAHSTAQRLVRNVRENYPAESKELDRITGMTQPAGRAVALSSAHKAATFAHLLQTTLYHQGHALRHAQVMHGEDPDDSMWDFDAEHSARHTQGALEHIHKLAQHVADNYPEEAGFLAELHRLDRQDGAAKAGMNGNGRHR